MGQLDLFGKEHPEPVSAPQQASPTPELAARHSSIERFRRAIPMGVHFGTSSWVFPDWAGIVYPEQTTERQLRERGLLWYREHPLLTTVGIDSSYYRPPSRATLRKYTEQLPEGFPCVIKVYRGLVQLADSRTHRQNEYFLSPRFFEAEILRPLLDEFSGNVGCLVFEFPPMKQPWLLAPGEFAARLDRFFGSISTELQYGVELRNPEFLCKQYAEVIDKHGLAHVINFWEHMPSLDWQWTKMRRVSAGPVVLRLMLPPGEKYAARKRALSPFNRLQDPQPLMRKHTLEILRQAADAKRQALVIVNNKAEGCSPLSIEELARQLALQSADER